MIGQKLRLRSRAFNPNTATKSIVSGLAYRGNDSGTKGIVQICEDIRQVVMDNDFSGAFWMLDAGHVGKRSAEVYLRPCGNDFHRAGFFHRGSVAEAQVTEKATNTE